MGSRYRVGVHTLPELLFTGAGPEAALGELRQAFDALLEDDRFVIMLGGEHSISAPPIEAHARGSSGDGRRLSVLQLDAHGDLRAEYEGTPFSHACVMYRVHQLVDLVPVGIRAITAEERRLIRERKIPMIFGHELDPEGPWIDRALGASGPMSTSRSTSISSTRASCRRRARPSRGAAPGIPPCGCSSGCSPSDAWSAPTWSSWPRFRASSPRISSPPSWSTNWWRIISERAVAPEGLRAFRWRSRSPRAC